MTKMSKRDHARLSAYLRTLQGYLGRGDWDINLSREYRGDADDDGGERGSCLTESNGYEATIWVSEWAVRQSSAEELRRLLVHELLHTHESHVAQHVKDVFMEPASVDQWNSFQVTHQRLRERMVDHLAFHIAKLLPLPEDA